MPEHLMIDQALMQDGPEDAPVLVVAGSLAAAPSIWDAQVRQWSRHRRVLRLLYPGHGGRPADPAIDTMAALAGDLQRRLAGLGITRYAFCGLSLGGMLGLHIAANSSEILRLCVGNCRWFQTDATRAMWDQRLAAVQAGGLEAIADGTLATWITEGYRQAHPDIAQATRRMIVSTSPQGYTACARIVQGHDNRPELARITCPVMVVSADQDKAAPTDHLAALAAELPGARLLEIAQCAHLSTIEGEQAWTRDAGDFLLDR